MCFCRVIANSVCMNQNTFNAWDAIKATVLWWSPVVAGFIGSYGTNWLTRSREQEAWIRACEKEEWRELFTALTRTETMLDLLARAVNNGASLSAGGPV